MKNLASTFKPVLLIGNQSATATVTGSAVDIRPGELTDAVLIAAIGAVTGAPSTQSITIKIQNCATSGGTYTDLATFTASTAGTAQVGSVQVILDPTKPFHKAVATIAFTGGTTPAYPVAVTLLLKQADATDNNLVALT